MLNQEQMLLGSTYGYVLACVSGSAEAVGLYDTV